MIRESTCGTLVSSMILQLAIVASFISDGWTIHAFADGTQSDRVELLKRLDRFSRKPVAPDAEIADLYSAVAQQLKDRPDDAELLYWLADLTGRKNDVKSLEAAYSNSLAAARKQTPPNHEIESRSLRGLAQWAITRRQGPRAVKLLKEAIQASPSDVANYRLLLDCQLQNGNPLELVDDFRMAAEKNAVDRPAIRSLYFELLATVGDWNALRADVERQLQKQPLEADARHFRGILANLDGKPIDAFVEHFLAVELGKVDRPTMQQSRAALDALVQKDDPTLPASLRAMVLAYRDSNRKSEAAAALAALDTVKSSECALAPFVVELLRSNALTQLGKHSQVLDLLLSLRKRFPDLAEFPSILIGLGESLEALDRPAEAKAYFETAKRVASGSPAVQRIFRLGGQFRAVKEGVEVTAIEAGTYLENAGVGVSDVLLELDRDVLADLSTFNRLRAVRLYFGGTITLKTRTGEIARREMDLIYFRD